MLYLRFGGSNGFPRDDYRGLRLINLCGDDPVAKKDVLPTWDCRGPIRTRRWFCRGGRAFIPETRRLAHRDRRHLGPSDALDASPRYLCRARSGAFVKITTDMFQWPMRVVKVLRIIVSQTRNHIQDTYPLSLAGRIRISGTGRVSCVCGGSGEAKGDKDRG